MKSIEPGLRWPLMDGCATRRLEKFWQSQLPPHTLMKRAGLACARLALAIAPHARSIWVACGPGNNGGDGLLAAAELARRGKRVWVTWLGTPERAPGDTRAAWQAFAGQGLALQERPPASFDLCVDALLGIGAQRPPQDRMAAWISHINRVRLAGGEAKVLSIDLPSGLIAGSGRAHDTHVSATHTLSLLTLKTGLFTNQGRDACGELWFDDLGTGVGPASATQADETGPAADAAPTAWLNPAPAASRRAHASHKGSHGEVALIGGAPGMAGALWLAASAALHQGAGKVFAAALDDGAPLSLPGLPEVMCRRIADLPLGEPKTATVCGCGGGLAVDRHLDGILAQASRLVLDADALNALAQPDEARRRHLRSQVRARGQRQAATVLTPHPLEAARLLQSDAAQVQANRLDSARALAEHFHCTVVLKGSGSVIAAPGRVSHVNPTGNGHLATAGTGDVLAGMIGARLAAGQPAFEAACEAVYLHGGRADEWARSPLRGAAALTASRVAAGG